MIFIAGCVYFFISGFSGYLYIGQRGSSFSVLLLMLMPILGVYFLGWWALLIFVIGYFQGSTMFYKEHKNGD